MNQSDPVAVVTREQAEELLRDIKRAASRLAHSGHRDLTNRATEIEAMAHYLLYDFDAGQEVE